ncbi:MAG: signal peptidase I [Chloroflexota bacterium]|nr:signal peptidase I [Chloroflexota bacterium]
MDHLRNISKNTILVFAISIAFQILLGNYVVDGNSMDPTLRNDQRVFVNKFVYFDPIVLNRNLNLNFDSTLNPKKGDVVVFDPPFPYDASGKQFVKRIIAVPGDTIENSSGIILVNGKPFGNDFGATSEISEVPKTLVPEGYYYVLGDNRNSSNDSRNFGFVPRTSIIGRVWVIYWPFSNFKIFDYNLISASNG